MNRKRLLALPCTLIICFSLSGSLKASLPPPGSAYMYAGGKADLFSVCNIYPGSDVHKWTLSTPPDGFAATGTPTLSNDQISAPAILPFPSKVGRPLADNSQFTIGVTAESEGNNKKNQGMAQTIKLELAPLGEPAALLLIGSGLIGLAKFGMRKYRKLTSRRVKEIIKIKPPAV